MKIKVQFLIAPGSGNNAHGKFYIAICDDRAAATFHGPNSTGVNGQITTVKDSRAVEKKIREKLRGEYSAVDPDRISKRAVQRAIQHIRRAIPELGESGYVLKFSEIEFQTASSPQRPRPAHGSGPNLSEIWF